MSRSKRLEWAWARKFIIQIKLLKAKSPVCGLTLLGWGFSILTLSDWNVKLDQSPNIIRISCQILKLWIIVWTLGLLMSVSCWDIDTHVHTERLTRLCSPHSISATDIALEKWGILTCHSSSSLAVPQCSSPAALQHDCYKSSSLASSECTRRLNFTQIFPNKINGQWCLAQCISMEVFFQWQWTK